MRSLYFFSENETKLTYTYYEFITIALNGALLVSVKRKCMKYKQKKNGNRQQEIVSFLWFFFRIFNKIAWVQKWSASIIRITLAFSYNICIFYSIPLRMLCHYYLDSRGLFFLTLVYIISFGYSISGAHLNTAYGWFDILIFVY